MTKNSFNHQKHLSYKKTINLGSYYTNSDHISNVFDFIAPYIDKSFTILDSSCGYGNFLQNISNKKIGNDIDKIAIDIASENINDVSFFNFNALENVNRSQYEIEKNEKLCIVGNPPYNDKTSIIRNKVKEVDFNIDDDIKTRDLGISFLKSYAKLNADIICVLHPLSYLIKKANFSLLKKFSQNYKLIKAKIISSESFIGSSKGMPFPIIIGLYTKNNDGMSFDYIKNFNFEIKDNLFFKINSFDYMPNYIKKYPSKYDKIKDDSVLFWTLRDINALKRNKTFIHKENQNAILIELDKLDYYIYVDVFKRYTSCIPYYLGNCDIIIDNNLFLEYKKYFILDGLFHNPHLRKHYANFDFTKSQYKPIAKKKILSYFHKLLGEHICKLKQ